MQAWPSLNWLHIVPLISEMFLTLSNPGGSFESLETSHGKRLRFNLALSGLTLSTILGALGVKIASSIPWLICNRICCPGGTEIPFLGRFAVISVIEILVDCLKMNRIIDS